MPDDQVDVTPAVVAALVGGQFPQWRGLPVRAVPSHGTVNALFRVGDEVVLRFPLRPGPEAHDELVSEQENARRFAPYTRVALPEPLGLGAPGPGYPGSWAAYRWIPGTTADGVTDLGRIWDRCREVPRGDRADVWIHADLMPGNLLVRDGRLAAVIDLGLVGVGDPAVDLMPAWNLLDPAGRAAYRQDLAVGDETWERGRGWTILQAIGALWYYVETNPVMAATARHTLTAVLADS